MRRTRRIYRGIAALTIVGLSAVAIPAIPAYATGDADFEVVGCERADLGGHSVARVWDEALLELIRQVVPAPTVHARNLFHTSVAMWDAWAAYDASADGYVVTEKAAASNVTEAREAAISYAVYRLLLWRYGTVSDLPVTAEQLDAVMASLCYRTDFESTVGDSPAALGNRIAAAIIEYGSDDGALENERYVDSSYTPANEPLLMSESGTVMRDPNRWQPLALEEQIAQNGLPIPGSVQNIIGPHWGHVTSFAMPPSEDGIPIDPGPPPLLGDQATDEAFKQAAVNVLRLSSELDPSDGVEIDISPGALGNNTLGSNDGQGYDVNPVTEEPYEPNVVLRANYARTLAEFWADGPHSETPPGHWNVIANDVTDSPGFERRIGGVGEVVDPLEWDVKLYLALNGAVHDAAIAAWGLKGYYDSVRPISMVRYMGGLGQSSDPDGPSYDPEGLPLVDDLVEVVTEESSAPGERHRGTRRPRRRGRRPDVARVPRRPRDRDQWGRLDPRRRLGALPAVDVRDSGVPGLRLRAQHVQPGRRRGDGRVHRRHLLPGRAERVHAAAERAAPRGGSHREHHPAMGDLLRRRRSGRRVAHLHGHPHHRGRLQRPPDRVGVRS